MEGDAQAVFREGCEIFDLCIFDGSDADLAQQNRALERFETAAAIDPKWDRPLVQACFLLYKRFPGGSEVLLPMARRAIERAPTVDAVEFYCKSALAVAHDGLAQGKAATLMEAIVPLTASDPASASLANIYRAIAAYQLGNFSLYCLLLRRFLVEAKPFRPYVYVQASTSNTNNSVAGEWKPPKGMAVQDPPDIAPDTKLVWSVSCDGTYFQKYSKYLFGSFARHASASTLLHLGLVEATEADGSLREAVLSAATAAGLAGHVVTSGVRVPTQENIGPVSSLMRLVFAWLMRSRVRVPVITTDFDAVLLKDPLTLLEMVAEGDVGLRVRKGCAPWEKYTAGASVFMPTVGADIFLRLIAAHAGSVLDMSGGQWWIDQNCIEAAWRHCATSGPAVNVKDIEPLLWRSLLLPTGTGERKIKLMEEAIAK